MSNHPNEENTMSKTGNTDPKTSNTGNVNTENKTKTTETRKTTETTESTKTTEAKESKVPDNNTENHNVQNNDDRSANEDAMSALKALEEAKQKAEENWNLFLRTRADMDNIRRRAQLDNENARKFAIEKFARELLVVIDSLEHGILVAEKAGDAAYKEGMVLTLKLFLDILEKFDIKRLDPKNEMFDPNKHEAISMQENSEVAPNSIVLVAQAGFTLNDRVLRPARVVVAKAPEVE